MKKFALMAALAIAGLFAISADSQAQYGAQTFAQRGVVGRNFGGYGGGFAAQRAFAPRLLAPRYGLGLGLGFGIYQPPVVVQQQVVPFQANGYGYGYGVQAQFAPSYGFAPAYRGIQQQRVIIIRRR